MRNAILRINSSLFYTIWRSTYWFKWLRSGKENCCSGSRLRSCNLFIEIEIGSKSSPSSSSSSLSSSTSTSSSSIQSTNSSLWLSGDLSPFSVLWIVEISCDEEEDEVLSLLSLEWESPIRSPGNAWKGKHSHWTFCLQKSLRQRVKTPPSVFHSL